MLFRLTLVFSQEARRVVAAEIQHITLSEFLPALLGESVTQIFGLKLVSSGYYKSYDPEEHPGISNVFAAAAFRFGHSLVPQSFHRYDRNHRVLLNGRHGCLTRVHFAILYKLLSNSKKLLINRNMFLLSFTRGRIHGVFLNSSVGLGHRIAIPREDKRKRRGNKQKASLFRKPAPRHPLSRT